jgi:DNA-binding response OmpR family regulator
VAGARILIVDDDREFLHELSTALTGAGFQTVTAVDVKTAETILTGSDRQLDLLIVDLVLPGSFSGFDIISAVTKTKPPYKVIATSAVYRDSVLEYVASQVGVDAYVEKNRPGSPFIAEVWIETVRRLLAEDAVADRQAG